MSIDKEILNNLKAGQYTKAKLKLENINNKEAKQVIKLLRENPKITELDLTNNELTADILPPLIENTTLKTLRLKPGNPAITIDNLCDFTGNHSLTSLPFRGGSGPKINNLRQHITGNKNNVGKAVEKKRIKVKQEVEENEEDKLTPSVTSSYESGQVNFLQLVKYFLFDLEEFKSKTDYIIWYMAMALNFNMHMASHRPMLGYGQAQAREEELALYYGRSQTNHPIRVNFDALTKTATDERKTSVLPLNDPFKKFLIGSIVETDNEFDENSIDSIKQTKKRKELAVNLLNIDSKRGFPKQQKAKKKKTIPQYFLILTHAGLRSNNVNTLTSGLIASVAEVAEINKATALTKNFKSLLPKELPKNIDKLDTDTVTKRIKKIQARFLELQQQHADTPRHKNLGKIIQTQRAENNQLICKQATQKLVELDENEASLLTIETCGAGCIIINIDSTELSLNGLGSDYNKEATNIILGFFGGLLNYYANLEELDISTIRRQSFGFLRPTITDLGEFSLRLSLGLEPAVFNEIVVKALVDLHSVLRANISFPAKLKMNSIKKQRQSIWETQYYLANSNTKNHKKAIVTAFRQYLTEFPKVVKEEEYRIKDYANFSRKKAEPSKLNKRNKANFNKTALFAVLQNTIHYALEFVASFDAYVEKSHLANLKHSYWHSLLKLYNYCTEALVLLDNIDKYEITAAYAEANSLLENIIEYLIALDTLKRIQLHATNTAYDRKAELVATEQKYLIKTFNLDKSQISIYFTDSGQQAIVSSLLAMDLELFLTDEEEHVRGDQSIYNFSASYYELDSFMDDIGGLRNKNKETSSIVFIDITQLEELKLKHFPALKAIIIDITRDSCLDNELLKNIVNKAHRANKWVVLTCSCLKHEQLGQDKYLVGRNYFLAPEPDMTLAEEVVETLTAISNDGAQPAIFSYLQMMNEICQDKPLPAKPTATKPQLTTAGSAGLQRNKFLNGKQAGPMEVDLNSKTKQKIVTLGR